MCKFSQELYSGAGRWLQMTTLNYKVKQDNQKISTKGNVDAAYLWINSKQLLIFTGFTDQGFRLWTDIEQVICWPAFKSLRFVPMINAVKTRTQNL